MHIIFIIISISVALFFAIAILGFAFGEPFIEYHEEHAAGQRRRFYPDRKKEYTSRCCGFCVKEDIHNNDESLLYDNTK